MLFLVLLVIVAAYLYKKSKKTYQVLNDLGINHPKPIPLFGNVGEFKDKFPLDVLKAWSKIYGKVYGFYEGLRPCIVIADPELIQQILVKQYDKFKSRPLCTPFQNKYDELSILNTHGDQWKNIRQVVATSFNSTSLNQMIPKMVSKSNNLLLKLNQEVKSSSNGFEISELFDRHMLDTFAYAAFDYDCNSLMGVDEVMYQYIVEFSKAAFTENPVSGIARLFPSLTPICQFFTKSFKKAHEIQLKQLESFIDREKKRMLNESNPEHPNVINKLLTSKASYKDENNNTCKRHLSQEEVLSQLTSMVSGGLDAAAAVTSFLIYCLALHQNVQEKVFEEIQLTFDVDEEITLQKLSSLPYLDMVIDETQRVYPVTPGIARLCTEDTTINGIQFRQGMNVKIMSCVMYQDEEIFPEPDKFIPERFSKTECDKRHPMTWLPFGAGPKNCLGSKLGLLKCKIAAVQIIRHFKIERSSKTEVPLKTKLHPILAAKNGVHIKLIPRDGFL